jgi:RHS repeat-associated protein
MSIGATAATSTTARKGFGELFGEAKGKLDSLQKSMASILPAIPGQNVAKYFDLAIGIDGHSTLTPPSPLLPVPHVGMVFDTMGAVMSAIACVVPPPPPPPEDGSDPPTSLSGICKAIVHSMKPTVQVHGQWVANAGTGIQHLPGITAHLPFPVVAPMASSEMWMGSSTVLADGGPCSTQFHPALSCNLVGIPAPPRKTKTKPKVALMAPTSVLLVITSGGGPVMVGGPPTIDLFQLAMQLGLKGMGKLWKKSGDAFQNLIDKIKTKNPKLGKILQPIKCRLFGEPVDAATGRVYSTNTDIELPGPIPFVWQRTYYSDAESNGPLGYNWHHSYNMGLYDMGNGFASICLADGRETVVPLLETGDAYTNRKEQLTFTKDEKGYLLIGADTLHYRFEGKKNREGYRMLSEIATSEGFTISFEYNYKGDLSRITDSRNQVIDVTTDNKGYITGLYTEADGKTITLIAYQYDELGNMVYIKDVAGAEKQFYYKGHLLVQLTNQTGQSFYWEYEGSGDDARCIHTWGDGGVLEYWTEYRPGHTLTRNGLGHTAHYFYDKDHLIYKIIDENGGVTHQTYNAYQELEVVVDPEGLSQKYEYNNFGKLIKLENENGQATTYEYDDRQNLARVNTPSGRKVEWEYDTQGRVQKKTMPDGNTLKYAYEGMHLKSITDAQDNQYLLHFDARHQLVQLTYPNETFRQWQYDDRGNVVQERDTRSNRTRYGYDDAGNVTYIAEPDGNEHHFEYDSSYNIISAKDDLHEVQFRYGSLGVLLSRTQNGRTVRFGYDNELQLKSINNEAGEVYRFALDGLGNVISEWGFDGLNRRYERDSNGRVTKVLRPAEKWSRYQYDGLGNVVLEAHSDHSWAAYKYDKDSMLAEALNEDIQIKLQRDRAGRVIKEVQGAHSLTRTYDKWGDAIQLESSLGADITLDYNKLGQVTQMTANTSPLGGGREGAWKAAWLYDESGLEIQRELSGSISVKTERDRYGRVTRRSIGTRNAEQARHRYHWGKGSRLHSIVNELGRATTNFEYDAWDNLVSGTYSDKSGAETIYKAPDAIGNLFKTPQRKDRQYDKGGKLLRDEKYYYHYDAEGNLVFKEFITSGQPNVFDKKQLEKKLQIKINGSGVGWIYQWAGNGMLAKVTLPQGKDVKFNYDPLGRRIAKQYKGKVTRWLWDGNVPLHEWNYEGEYPPGLSIDATGSLKEEQEPVENLITWIYEQGSFVPCGKITGEEEYSIVSDYLGTPTHAFNSKGEKVWERELDIYGAVRKEIGQKRLVPQLYQGQWVDNETGLAYNRFRYYDNESGMYLSCDPSGLNGGYNSYCYVSDSNFWSDVFGLHHDLEAEVIRDGESLGKKPYQSGGTKGHKNQHEALKTHTERKFIDDVVGDLAPGDHLKMTGELNPCRPGCQPTIRDIVYKQDVTAEYKATSTGKTYSWKKEGNLVYQTEVDVNGKKGIFKYNMEAKKIRRVEVKPKHNH